MSSIRDLFLDGILHQSNTQIKENLRKLFDQYAHQRGSLHPSIGEALAVLTEQHKNDLWLSLGKYFTHCFWSQGETHDEHDDKRCSDIINVVMLADGCVSMLPSATEDATTPRANNKAPEKLIEFIVVLGGVLEAFDDVVPGGGAIAVSVCEAWTLKRLPEANSIARSLFTVLLRNSLLPSAKKLDVKRVYQQRESLSLCATENETLIESVCACLVSPLYISSDEGVKFLGHVMAQKECMKQGHAAVKKFLPYCSKTQATKLAHAYCRAWRNSTPTERKIIEIDCMQDLMYCAMTVHPINASQFNGNMRAFLHVLHVHQKLQAFATVLQKSYNPFIWRSLTCANGLVRTNATHILCDAYPLEDVSATHEEREQHLTKVHSTLTAALTDTCPSVRIVAIQGICCILHTFWLSVPKAIIQNWFTILITKLATDASSSNVRLQVVKGITKLLDCKDALNFLQKCLPQLAGSFDDVNTGVRIAVVRLLLKLHSLKLIKFWEVVPINHLLHRLAMDAPAVSKLLTKLLSPAFFPIHKEDRDLLERCLSLIGEDRGASRVFFEYASQGLDISSVVRVILLLFRALRGHLLHKAQQEEELSNESVNRKFNKRSRRSGEVSLNSDDKENQEASCSSDLTASRGDALNESQDGPFDDPWIVGGLLDAIVVIWTTNTCKLNVPHNSEWLAMLQRKVAKGLPLMSSCFKNSSELSRTLLHLASFLPKNMVSTLVKHCSNKLKGMTLQDLHSQQNIHMYVNVLCNWNRTNDILELIKNWTTEAFSKVQKANQNVQLNTSSRSTRRSLTNTGSGGRRVSFPEEPDAVPQPEVGMAILEGMLCHKLNRLTLLHSSRDKLHCMASLMNKVMVSIDRRITKKSAIEGCSDEFLLGCWRQYLCLLTLIHHKNSTEVEHSPSEASQARPSRSKKTTSAPVEAIEEYDATVPLKDCIQWVLKLLPTLSRRNLIAPDISMLSLNNSSSNEGETTNGKHKRNASPRQLEVPVLSKTVLCELLTSVAGALAVGVVNDDLMAVIQQLVSATLMAISRDEHIDVLSSCVLVTSEICRYCVHYNRNDDSYLNILKECLSSILDTHSADVKVQLQNLLPVPLTLIPAPHLNQIMRHSFNKAVAHITNCRNNVYECSGISFIFNLYGRRQTFAQSLSVALRGLPGGPYESVEERVAAEELLQYIKEDPGKVAPASITAAIEAVQQAAPPVNEQAEDSDDPNSSTIEAPSGPPTLVSTPVPSRECSAVNET